MTTGEDHSATAGIPNLAHVPLLALLDDEECRALAMLLQTRSYTAGQEIFHQGDQGDSLFIVKSGRVRVFIESDEEEDILLTENKPGDVFGEISLLDGGVRTATAAATVDSVLFWLDRSRLLDFLTRYPHASLDLLTVMGHRLRSTDEMLLAGKAQHSAASGKGEVSAGSSAETGYRITIVILAIVILILALRLFI